jgi:hypothetical protein
MKLEFSRHIFKTILRYKISWEFVHWEPSCSIRPDRRTEVWADMTKLTVAICNFANAPGNNEYLRKCCFYAYVFVWTLFKDKGWDTVIGSVTMLHLDFQEIMVPFPAEIKFPFPAKRPYKLWELIADRLEKEATQNHYVTYSRIPRSAIKRDTRKESIRKWQRQ